MNHIANMKKMLVVLFLLCVSGQVFAQRWFKGFALGTDRDTLQYIIASPFDNWWVELGGGLQTFVGNEDESEARWNGIGDWNVRAEIGKWVLPDIALSLRASLFSVSGQSRYGRQPFIDLTGAETRLTYNPVSEEWDYYADYQTFHAHAVAVMGMVTFDWTNFIRGFEYASHRRMHVLSNMGFGAAMLFGEQKNPRDAEEYAIGSFRRNFELCGSVGMMAEYYFSERFSVNAALELMGTKSTFDWSPYTTAKSTMNVFDLVPSVSVGCRIAIFNHVLRYNHHTQQSENLKVNHRFNAYNPNNEKVLGNHIDDLSRRIDSLQNLAGMQESLVPTISQLERQRDSLQIRLDSVASLQTVANNLLEDIIEANEGLNLPASTIYFKINKADIDYNAMKRLQHFARDINNAADTLEYFVIGAADSLTGTPRQNMRLSERRCRAAHDMLCTQFGVSSSQLLLVPVGGITDYAPQENNRMVLIIQRTIETEAIVQRWVERRKGKQ
ncbi:MAG: OmpA family protein [Bacteroidales bacterium]|nr:OmpA family protein [Bacteroidales bacterium]MBR1799427.1 OmpA family protein [Bacteroidales bacterium]